MASTVTEFNKIHIANSDQKTILIEGISKDIIGICKKFQYDLVISDLEVKTLCIRNS